MSRSPRASLRNPAPPDSIALDPPHETEASDREKPRSQSAPVMMSPASAAAPAVPPLSLLPSSAAGKPCAPLVSGEPGLRSPRSRVRFSEPDAGKDGTSTPRGKSPRPAESVPLPGRRRIDSSQRHVASPRSPRDTPGIDIRPSSRGPNQALIELGNVAARLIFEAIRSDRGSLSKDAIVSLARFEVHIPLEKLPSELREKIGETRDGKVSHARLIKALYLDLLTESEAGKTLLAMRRMVMLQYGGTHLTLAERLRIEEKDLGFKARMQANLEGQARACAAIALGRVGSAQGPAISTSKLPAELVAFWKAMDRELCGWGRENPDLDADQLRTARENLGFDILFTRLMLPVALGGPDESHLVIPMMFFDAVKSALLDDWPAFAGSMITTQEHGSANTDDPSRAPTSTAAAVPAVSTASAASPRSASTSTPTADRGESTG